MFSSFGVSELLPPRPPTPPRDVHGDVYIGVDDAITFLDDSHEVERAIRHYSDGTRSVQSTCVAAETSSPCSVTLRKGTKRVDFSPQLAVLCAGGSSQIGHIGSQLPHSFPSESAKPPRSILKAKTQHTPLTPEEHESGLSYFSPKNFKTMEDLLRSVINQLRSDSRSMKLDAYLALHGALRAYQDLYAGAALVRHFRTLAPFLERDLVCKNERGDVDHIIVMKALKLVSALLADMAWSSVIDDEFKSFVVARSIEALERVDMPKMIIKLHMTLLGQHKFPAAIVTPARAERIITAMQTIEERCSGNNVIVAQMVIYRRFLDQHKAVMINRLRDWLEPMIHYVLSSIKEVRSRAVKTFLHAGTVLGSHTQATKALLELLDAEVEDGTNYGQYLNLRLLEMANKPETSIFVPQVWSAVVLFLRSKATLLDKHLRDKTWLSIAQKCFNSSDVETRQRAALAWNKLVYAVMPDSSTSKTTMEGLKIPIESGLVRRAGRESLVGSYCNLLHYALRPALSPRELEAAWDCFVRPLPSWMARSHTHGEGVIIRMVHSFCHVTSGVWNSEAALQDTPLTLTELPKLGSRWVRAHLNNFLDLLEPLISGVIQSPVKRFSSLGAAWHVLMQSIAEAGSQEIRMSNELKQAIAGLVKLFRRLWDKHFRAPIGSGDDHSLATYMCFVDITIDTIGANHFVEEILTTRDDSIEVAPTPSSREIRPLLAAQSPFVVLAAQFSTLSTSVWRAEDQHACDAFAKLLKQIPDSLAQTCRPEMLRRCLRAGAPRCVSETDSIGQAQMWTKVATILTHDLSLDTISSAKARSPIGNSFQSALAIFVDGWIYASDPKCWRAAAGLYDVLLGLASTFAEECGGVAVLITSVLDVLAKSDPGVHMTIQFRLGEHLMASLPHVGTLPEDHSSRASEIVIDSEASGGLNDDTLQRIVLWASDVLTCTYDALYSDHTTGVETIQAFFVSVRRLLELHPNLLEHHKAQAGFKHWIEDAQRKTGPRSGVSALVCDTWRSLIPILQNLLSKDDEALIRLERLVIGGLSSPHRSIVQDTASLWNAVSGRYDKASYSSELRQVLRARANDVQIDISSFAETTSDRTLMHLPILFDDELSLMQKPTVQAEADGIPTLDGVQDVVCTSNSGILREDKNDRSTADAIALGASEELASSTPQGRSSDAFFDAPFAPLDSSPIRQPGSALQNGVEQDLPSISSSPVAAADPYGHSLRKKLESIRADRVEQREGTPTGFNDANLLQSDDLQSSPTPSSIKKHVHKAVADDDYCEEVEDLIDPPSSPPQSIRSQEDVHRHLDTGEIREEHDDDVLVSQVVTSAASELIDAPDSSDHQQSPTERPEAPEVERIIDSTVLANVVEIEAIEDRDATTVLSRTNSITAEDPHATEDVRASSSVLGTGDRAIDKTEQGVDMVKITSTRSAEDIPAPENDAKNDLETAEIEAVRIEDSFVGPIISIDGQNSSVSSSDTPESQRSARKRKRPSAVVYTTRKKARSSKGSSSADVEVASSQLEDDYMDDEIVVAPRSSAISQDDDMQRTSGTSTSVSTAPPEQQDANAEQDEVVAKIMTKKSRGRPRKNNLVSTPNFNNRQVEHKTGAFPVKTLSRKRKAAQITDFDEKARGLANESDIVTPAPTKSRKSNRQRGLESIDCSLQTIDASRARPSQQSRQGVVVIHTPLADAAGQISESYIEVDESERTGEFTPEQQLIAEQEAAEGERLIATPRSILGRLRDAIKDLSSIFVSKPEEREFDDVLFELRQGVHEAARRRQ